jgi:hypothetical protein
VTRRSRLQDPEALRRRLIVLLENFEKELNGRNLRGKVQALVPAHHLLRDLGSSLIPSEGPSAARDRILRYLQKYPKTVIRGGELMVVAGIGEWARRVRELRVQFGWSILTGVTVHDMVDEGEPPVPGTEGMRPDDYMLLNEKEDRDAAHRWNIAHEIRNGPGSVRDRILAFLRRNAGVTVSGEELRYVAKDKKEWARRVRELRTEFGWPVVTKNKGRPDLPVGFYLLEQDRQSPAHDRKIPDPVRVKVLKRDGYACTACGWSQKDWNKADSRNLELHHVKHHAKGGENTEANLTTLCTVCHDDIHRKSDS